MLEQKKVLMTRIINAKIRRQISISYKTNSEEFIETTLEKQKLIESTSFVSSVTGSPRPTAALSSRDPSK